MFSPDRFLDFDHTAHRVIFDNVRMVWQAIDKIGPYLQFRLKPGVKTTPPPSAHIGENVFIDEGTTIEPGVHIKGPAWIGKNCQIRSGCYIRENVILGDGVVAGNSCEFKNSLVFDSAEVPHFNYVGDSILGHHAHLGAGVILSNVRLDRRDVVVSGADGKPVATGLRKFGAIIGDFAEVGCNSVLSPGSILGRHSIIYPCIHWRGVLEEKKIARARQEIDIIPRRE